MSTANVSERFKDGELPSTGIFLVRLLLQAHENALTRQSPAFNGLRHRVAILDAEIFDSLDPAERQRLEALPEDVLERRVPFAATG